MRMVAALIVGAPLWAQTVSLGVRTGASVTPMLAGGGHPRYVIGPLVEVHLWRGASVGADFLFEHAALGRGGLWRWEAPVTVVYRFRASAKPFVRAGVSFNRVFGINGASPCGRGPFGEQFYCVDGAPVAELRHRGTAGFAAGGGFRFKLTRIWLEPEARLTRWVDRNFGVGDSVVRSNLSQVQLLVGVVF